MTPSHNPGRLLALSGAYWQTCALHAGVKLNVFTVLGRQVRSATQVAERIQADERAAAMLLNALVAMGLLRKDGDGYGNTDESLIFLDQASPSYQGHIILHHHQLMPSWAVLDEAVRTGRPVRKRPSFDHPETRRHFLMGMFNLAMGLAPQVVAAIDLSDRRRLLDLGGGPGTYAVHFCKRYPTLTGVVFDLPASQPFAEEVIRRFDMTERVAFAGGDYHETPLPGSFDVIWLSHILHAENPADCRRVIQKAAEALETGGMMIIHDFYLNDDMDGPLFPALFALNMLLGTDGGRAYSHAQVEAMMQQSGLHGIERRALDSPNASGLLIGTK